MSRGSRQACPCGDTVFENISERFGAIFDKLRYGGKLTEANIRDGLRDLPLAARVVDGGALLGHVLVGAEKPQGSRADRPVAGPPDAY